MAQPGAEHRRDHGEKVLRGIAGPDPEKPVHWSNREQAIIVPVDQHGGRRMARQQRPLADLGEIAPCCRCFAPHGRDEGQLAIKAEREVRFSRPGPRGMTVEAFGPCQRLEPAIGLADRLGRAEKQDAGFAQREVEERDHPRLREAIEIDQEIAAGNHVEPRERRICQHILHRENDMSAQGRHHAEAAILLGEIARKSFRRDRSDGIVRIKTFARSRYGIGVEIRSEYLQLDVTLCLGHYVLAYHRDRVCLFAGTAPRHPDAQGLTRDQPVKQIGQDHRLQRLENLGIAKEASDVDEQFARQQAAFGRIAAQSFGIGGHIAIRHGEQCHAACDAAADRAGFVVAEILPSGVSERVKNGCEIFGAAVRRNRHCRMPPKRDTLDKGQNRLGHVHKWQDRIDQRGIERGLRHAGMFGLCDRLGENHAAGIVERSKPLAAIAARAGEDPALLRVEGEAYRDCLLARVRALGLDGRVVFINRFVERPELLDYIAMCDVYVTPYLLETQMTSGTLAYSHGLGRPVVSTPYWHATELLGDGSGVLVPFRDPIHLGAAVAHLLTDEPGRLAMGQSANLAGRLVTWTRTALAYRTAFKAACEEAEPKIAALPLTHFAAMCDDTGLFQHAVGGIPDRQHGYCIDDNARALLLSNALGSAQLSGLPGIQPLRFAAFIQHGWNPDRKRFRNFLGFDRRWLEEVGPEDSHGRTLWALGMTAAENPDTELAQWAANLFAWSLESVEGFTR